jgi:hypothetical protein
MRGGIAIIGVVRRLIANGTGQYNEQFLATLHCITLAGPAGNTFSFELRVLSR